MKKTFIVVCGMLFILMAKAQNLPNFRYIRIVDSTDFNENTDKAALQAADYLLSVPPSPNNRTWDSASDYLLNWIAGTPKYKFSLDETGLALIKKDATIMLAYMSALVKSQLENTTSVSNSKNVKVSAIKILIAYANNPSNGIKISGELKKIIEADNKGQLEAYLKL